MSIDDEALEYLKSGEIITPAIGEEKWRCLAVHSLIARLRKRGHRISCKRRFDASTRRIWGEYRLLPAEQIELFPCAAQQK